MKLSEITPNAKNPRLIKEERFKKLVRSLENLPDFTAIRAIILDEDKKIIGGNMRFRAMQHLKWKWAIVQVYDREYHAQTKAALELGKSYEDVCREMVIRDNVAYGEHDFDILANEYDPLELDEWGLDVWTGEPEETEGLTDPDDIPEVPEEAKTKLGDLYILGEHRLLCGDSTKAEDVEKLMNGEKADMVFTDPPYGVDYDGGHAVKGVRREKLKNDGTADIYKDSISIMYMYSKKDTPLYLWYSDSKSLAVLSAVLSAGYEIRNNIIWNKNVAQFGAIGAQYKTKHEPCLYCYKKGQKSSWIGPNNEVSVWDIDRNRKNEHHPTQKPIALAERCIKNHEVDSILDLFLGSGSTLIAAEKLNRKCYGMELDPKYCDVIVKRWEDFTGKKAELWKQ